MLIENAEKHMEFKECQEIKGKQRFWDSFYDDTHNDYECVMHG